MTDGPNTNDPIEDGRDGSLICFVKIENNSTIYGVFHNGLIRRVTGVEWYDLRQPGGAYEAVPVHTRPASELEQYAGLDNALRA